MSIEQFKKTDEIKNDPNGNDIDKINVYRWEEAGEHGQFKMINKKSLKIDLEYQRELIAQERSIKIARLFKWTLFGALMVIERDNGDLFVVDGGHRLRATWKRSDITDVPCMVYTAKSIREEAKMFVDLNTSPVGMSAYQRFRAQLVAEEPYAVQANTLIQKYGYVFTKHGGEQFSCGAVQAIQNKIKRNNEAADKTIKILTEICEGEPLRKNPVDALFYLITNNGGIDFYNEYPFIKMKNAGIDAIENEIIRVTRIAQKGGEKVSAMGLLNIINSGSGTYRKQNRVKIPA